MCRAYGYSNNRDRVTFGPAMRVALFNQTYLCMMHSALMGYSLQCKTSFLASAMKHQIVVLDRTQHIRRRMVSKRARPSEAFLNMSNTVLYCSVLYMHRKIFVPDTSTVPGYRTWTAQAAPFAYSRHDMLTL